MHSKTFSKQQTEILLFLLLKVLTEPNNQYKLFDKEKTSHWTEIALKCTVIQYSKSKSINYKLICISLLFFLQFPVSIGLNQLWRHNIAFYDKDVDAEYVGGKN